MSLISTWQIDRVQTEWKPSNCENLLTFRYVSFTTSLIKVAFIKALALKNHLTVLDDELIVRLNDLMKPLRECR